MRAIGYFRDASNGADSLASQNKAFLDYCAKEGLEAGSTFVDSVVENGHGRGFRELVSYLKRENGGAAVVVVTTLEALGVDALDAVRRFYQIESIGAHVTAMQGETDPIGRWGAQDPGSRIGER